ncbi:hypothetical protein P154DRAFT_526382 [Amniculicola lignicola CBS 123094]|uniref:Uncharacterized protein n=1 Tax=Amniculicola lignicola CBS 123094 TaxID=1392246 RepID=A0A6A5W0N3_9PLEO|nr:hypothetical protein P154DRAFT_526382 [Amniculicola lignicola CBS 123094]
MQLTIALVATIFASAISAAPAMAPRDNYPTVRVSLYNDQTGHMATASVLSDGMANMLTDLFRGSAIDDNGHIKVTSAQLVQSTQKTRCFFQNYNDIINMSGADNPFVDLDGNPAAALVRDMSGFNLQCSERAGA